MERCYGSSSVIPLALFALLQVADVYTTMRILDKGGEELNQTLAKLFAKYEPLPTLVSIKAIAIGAFALADNVYLTSAFCVVYAAVVANNVRVLKGMK
jgi:hypothetical protein